MLFHLACPEEIAGFTTLSSQKGSFIMKTIIRCLVIALAVTGAIATTYASGSTATSTFGAHKTSAMPVPRCPPDDPDGCGIGG
jgi:hypothetical protein